MIEHEAWTFRADDHVELINAIPGRKELSAGKRAVVVVGNEGDDGDVWGMVSIVLAGPGQWRLWRVRPRHLRLIQRPTPAPEGRA